MKLVSYILIKTALTTPTFANEYLKVADEPVELTIHMHWPRAQGYIISKTGEPYPVELAVREMTGVTLSDASTGRNSNNSNETMTFLLAQGNIPDTVGGHLIQQPVNQFGSEAAFVPLNDLVTKHAPNIQAFGNSHPSLQQAITAYDGNGFYISYLPDGQFGRAWVIRQDWLGALRLEQPQNVDEFYEVMVAFRDQNPNGNGEKDETPHFARQWEEVNRLHTLWDARSSGSETYDAFYVKAAGELVHPYAHEAYKVGLTNIAKWYAEGLIDPEFFTRGSSSRDYLPGENLGGVTHDWFASTSGYNASLADKVDGFNFIPFLPPASVAGVRMEEHHRIPIKPDGWAISYQAKDPVTVIKYFDFWFTEEGRWLSNFGVEGKTWNMIDGEPVFTDAVLNSGQAVNSQMYLEGAQVQRGYWQDFRYEWQWTAPAAREGIELYAANDLLERQQAWVLGSGSIEEDWDGYINTLNKMYYDDVIEVMNSACQHQHKQRNHKENARPVLGPRGASIRFLNEGHPNAPR